MSVYNQVRYVCDLPFEAQLECLNIYEKVYTREKDILAVARLRIIDKMQFNHIGVRLSIVQSCAHKRFTKFCTQIVKLKLNLNSARVSEK